MDIKEYYGEKQKNLTRLTKQLLEGKHPGQPELEEYYDDVDEEIKKRPSAVYVISVRNRQAGTTPGAVSIVTVGHAAQLITDGTHEIAKPEQIEGYLKAQADRLEQVRSAEWHSAAKKEIVREVVREVPTPAAAQPKSEPKPEAKR